MSKIELVNISKCFIDKKKKEGVYALYDVNTTFNDNELSVILGESGCGKTVLLKIIGGIEKVDEGSLLFDDIDYTLKDPKERNAAYLSQTYALYPHLTVFENIAYPLKVQNIPEEEIRRRVNEIIESFDLTEIKNYRPKSISGGERQRTAFARALVKKPDVLLLDEPLSNIDEKEKTKLLKEIKDIHTKYSLTILYVTHNIREAFYLSDNIKIMNNGTIVEEGKISELFNNKESYLYKNFIVEGPNYGD